MKIALDIRYLYSASAGVETYSNHLAQELIRFGKEDQQGAEGSSDPGRITLKSLPSPGRLKAVMSPPWARAMARARLRPNPKPAWDRLLSHR